ncbi:MAG: hypothetical protein GTO02_03840, partial [Candidatus Dadabacteria bacterium]|nr:hypothetical protein [Candidatus Dadabacteria bacterium]
MAPKFGTFLLIELWSSEELMNKDNAVNTKPGFKIFTVENEESTLSSTIETLKSGLKNIRVLKNTSDVEIIYGKTPAPSGLSPLIPHD